MEILKSHDEKQIKTEDLSSLPLDDQFVILLHKKIMNKYGATKRQATKYYKDQYKKTGIIPKPLQLAGQGIMEGRKCSGRRTVLDNEVIKRFKEMVTASTDRNDQRCIFITKRARKIKNYHIWLEEEFNRKISLTALRRYARKENLYLYLNKPDYEDNQISKTYFNPVAVFELVQVDGCIFQYIKIKDENNKWKKPQVIEFFDTGSRYMFDLDFYFSESNENSIKQFIKFLLSTPFPDKKIRLRPDNPKGFLNLKRPIRELNRKYSIMPDRFYMDPDFAGVNAPKHKVHLESSHRALHNFEMRIIKKLENKIVKTAPGIAFKNKKMEKITITYLDVNIQELRDTGLAELYRRDHNEKSHKFSEEGKTKSWIPKEKFQDFLSCTKTFEFDPAHIENFMKYGFGKKKATVGKDKIITCNNQKYYVTIGSERFSSWKSTTVYVSHYNNKLFIFEYKKDGIFLGEAMPKGPSEEPQSITKKLKKRLLKNEIEQIEAFLENKGITVKTEILMEKYRNGLTLACVKKIYGCNKERYDKYLARLNISKEKKGIALFNAFLMDCQRYHQHQDYVAPYAAIKED